MQKILIIDDDKKLTDLLDEFLSSNKFRVKCLHESINSLAVLETYKPDLVILDITLPEMDGFQVLREIRESSSVPVIMLTARGEVGDRIVGLELGADDYLSKPFEPRELLARMQSILRRSQQPTSLMNHLEFENLVIDKTKQEVLLDNEKLHLSTTEFEALLLMAENAGKTLDREFMVESLRGIEWKSYDRSVDVLVSRLRNKLGETPENTRFIKTVHGIGYRFVGVKKNN